MGRKLNNVPNIFLSSVVIPYFYKFGLIDEIIISFSLVEKIFEEKCFVSLTLKKVTESVLIDDQSITTLQFSIYASLVGVIMLLKNNFSFSFVKKEFFINFKYKLFF